MQKLLLMLGAKLRYEIQKAHNLNSYSLRLCATPVATTRRQSLQRGEPQRQMPQRGGTPARHWLRNALPWEPAQRTGSSA
ncbi:hypothetical protein NIES4075_65580 [Tolypothrix sp. NIES-4075]|nr:hypothetical protein NIES4075_65580 [Tolypothrix sp. NIES-4075]